LFCHGKPLEQRPAPGTSLFSQKMGIHEWAYKNDYAAQRRGVIPHALQSRARPHHKDEGQLRFDDQLALTEAQHCPNCERQQEFSAPLCIECDACMDICPVDCINFIGNADEGSLRASLRVPARNKSQDLYVSGPLKTGRIMAKDEDMCLHCGLCAERCPTGAWDMQKFMYVEAQASRACLVHHDAYLR